MAQSISSSFPSVQTIRCPHCGEYGERQYLFDQGIVKTECLQCDYLLITRAQTAQVVEAYVPGLSVLR